MDQGSYYMALVSNKGYFRLDVVKDSVPRTLVAWTEISNFNGTNIDFNIITYGTYIILVINGKWLAEVSDDTIRGGLLGFALASYTDTDTENSEDKTTNNNSVCKAYLDFISIDTRVKAIEESFRKWTDESNIFGESRLRLAETLAVMGETTQALEQIIKAWKRRDEMIRTVAASDAEVRTRKELLLAARLSFRLEQYREAEEYIDALINQCADEPQKLVTLAEGREALKEKIKILNELDKFAELKDFVLKHSDKLNKDIDYYTMLARCHWRLEEYKESAAAWKKAFETDRENGVYAANAGNALELAGRKKEALANLLEAGKIFLRQDNQPELLALMPKLLTLGRKNWEVHALAAKHAFSIEDYKNCAMEFTMAEKLRCALRPRPKADPALYYLRGLVSSLAGRTKEAIRMLEKTVKLAPDYGLFRFKLAEIKLTSGIEAYTEATAKLAQEFKLALEQNPDETMANHAGTLLLNAGDPKNATYFFNLAKSRTGTA
jgi:tetratricopeptide (TPR) repeat protein